LLAVRPDQPNLTGPDTVVDARAALDKPPDLLLGNERMATMPSSPDRLRAVTPAAAVEHLAHRGEKQMAST